MLASTGSGEGVALGTLIDASVLIAVERGRLDPGRVCGSPDRREEPAAIAAVTASELLHGVRRLGGTRRVAAERFARRWLDALPVIPFDLEIARVHAILGVHLARAGTAIGPHDLMIAATAVHLGYRVATRDRRGFHRVDGLTVEYW